MSQEAGTRAFSGHEPWAEADELKQLRQQNTELRNRMFAHAAVSVAQGILMERYRLPTEREGFELLRHSSQRHNIKLHTLANAVVSVPGPEHGSGIWFPDRVRTSPPALPGLRLPKRTDLPASQGTVLNSALRRVLDVTETTMGNIQLAEAKLLRLAKHTGLNREFTDHFAFVQGSGTSCAQAAQEREQVTVHDVATAAVFDEESRRVILHAGSRACHSVPLLDERNIPLGVISSHHSHPLTGFTRARLNALETVGAVVGRWLSWHRRTVVLDALEHLHTTAGHK